MQSRKLDAVQVRPLLHAILISEGEGLWKPDEAISRGAADRLAVECSACVFVGDHPDADVGGAKQARWRAQG